VNKVVTQITPPLEAVYQYLAVNFRTIDLKYLASHVTKIVTDSTTMWAYAQRDGRPAKYRLCPLFNVVKFG